MNNTNETPFDPNDPKLWSYVPEGIDPEADLVGTRFGPPEDGFYQLILKLRPVGDRLAANPYISPKSTPPLDVWMLAVCGVQVRTLEGQNRGFAKDFYVSTKKSPFEPTSSTHFLLKAAGSAVAPNAPLDIVRQALVGAFEKAGDEGITVHGRVRWVRAIKQPDGSYVDIKGKAKVSEYNLREATMLFNSQEGWSEEQKAKAIANVQRHPWLWYDEAGEERECRVEVAELKPARG